MTFVKDFNLIVFNKEYLIDILVVGMLLQIKKLKKKHFLRCMFV